MPDNDIGDWFRTIPIVTRWWFILSIAFPLAGRIGLLNPMYMFLSWEMVAYKFQVSTNFPDLVFSEKIDSLYWPNYNRQQIGLFNNGGINKKILHKS